MNFKIEMTISSMAEFSYAIDELKNEIWQTLAQEHLDNSKVLEIKTAIEYSTIEISDFSQGDLIQAYRHYIGLNGIQSLKPSHEVSEFKD